MHLVLLLALLSSAPPEPAPTLAVIVVDPAGAIVNNARVTLLPNRCTEWCEQALPQQRLEGRTTNGMVGFHPQPGVMYDMLVTRCGYAPYAASVFVAPRQQRREQVQLKVNSDWEVIEVCSDCPILEIYDPLDLSNARIPLVELPRLCLD